MDLKKQFELYRDAYIVDHPCFHASILCKTVDFDEEFKPLPKLYDGPDRNKWAMPGFIPTFSRVFEGNPLVIDPNIELEEPPRNETLEKLLDLFMEPIFKDGTKYYKSEEIKALGINHQWFKVIFISNNTNYFLN
ncbi:hypothetical protein [Flagellimonas aurea]|uniref:hypothetical protein n=1 Tax=Flagellimonas aurea TaxID=2915619 RepID=UPI0035D10235